MTTIAGTGAASHTGDGGLAFDATLFYPIAVAEDATGNLLVSDQNNLRVRGITALSALNSSSGALAFGTVSIGSSSSYQVVTLSAVGPVTINGILITGYFSEFDNCGTALTNGKTCKVYVAFKPTAGGLRSGTLTIQNTGFFSEAIVIALTGTSAPKTVTVTNLGAAAIAMNGIALNETTDFELTANTCPTAGHVLAGGANCTISVVFKPQSTGLKKSAVIIADRDGSSPQVVGLTGTAISNVTLAPASVVFPTQAVGSTTPAANAKKIILTNHTGANLTLGNPAITFTGPFSKISATSCNNNLVIANNGTCSIYVVFSPTTVGYPNGSLIVNDSDSTSPQSVSLSGTSTGVVFNPTAVDFGTSTVGRQVQSTVTITNGGQTFIYFTSWGITGTNARDFRSNASDPPCSGALAPGAACTFTMFFTPSLVGAETANFLVYDNSPGSPQVLPLTGTGQ